MTQANSSKKKNNGHHFLFHVFRMDKEENPMPTPQAENLLHQLRLIFIKKSMTDNRRN